MGNEQYKYIYSNVKKEHIEKVFNDNKEKKDLLKKLYEKVSRKKGYLTEENFKNILRLDNDNITKKLFYIFRKNNDSMYYSELENFYVIFSNQELNSILIAFLLLGKNETIEIDKYKKNLSEFFFKDDFKNLFNDKTTKEISFEKDISTNFVYKYEATNIKEKDESNKLKGKNKDKKHIKEQDKGQKNKEIINNNAIRVVSKKLLIEYLLKSEKINENFSFYSQIIPSLKSQKFQKHYVCDCLKGNNTTEQTSKQTLNLMNEQFIKDKLVLKGTLSLDNFKTMMSEIRVKDKLIKLIIDYLKKITLKNTINFYVFKDIMSKVCEQSSKNNFIFLNQMRTFINNQNNIKALLSIQDYEDLKDSNLEKLRNSGDNNKREIVEYIEYMFDLGLLPYIRYNLITDNLDIKKKIIKFILNGKNIQTYLEENFDSSNKFYPINIEFWKKLINETDKNELKINNSLIAEKDDIYYKKLKEEENKNDVVKKGKNNEEKGKNKIQIKAKLKPNKKYKDNYIIICGELYDRISNLFDFDYIIELEKTTIFSEPDKKADKNIEIKENKIDEKEEKVKDEKKGNKNIDEKIKITNPVKIPDKLDEKNGKNIEDKKEENSEIQGEKNERKIKVEEKEEEKEKKEEKETTKTIIAEKSEENLEEKKDDKEIKKIHNLSDNKQIEENIYKKEEENIIKDDRYKNKNEKEGYNESNPEKLKKEDESLIKISKKNKAIKEYIVDFNPIKYLELSFEYLNNRFKEKYKEKEDKKYKYLSKEEKNILDEEKKYKQKRKKEYDKEINKINYLFQEKKIDIKNKNEKIKNLKENEFKDLFEEEIRINTKDFIDILKNEMDNILFEKKDEIRKITRNITTEQIKYNLINNNKQLNKCDFDITFYKYKDDKFIDKYKDAIEKNENDFILILIDIQNKEGNNFLSTLEKNNDFNYVHIKDKITNNKNIKSKERIKQKEKEESQKEKEKRKEKEKEKQALLEKEKQKKKENQKIIHPPYGIPNFGNTCYFNSVNQIILNLPIINDLLKEKVIKYMINKENKFGYKGKLISSFIPLFELYSYEIEDKVRNLKTIVGKLNEIFNNTQQQDAHEYLNFILEGLHEELNLKSSKIYIVDNDDNYLYNSEDELGNIAWANNLRRNVSFIDSIFMLQLKSNLTCKNCRTKKVNFETSYVFNMPLSLCKMVTVHINLYRLPFNFKVYYAKINEKFKNFKENEAKKKINEILIDYYSNKLTFEERKEHEVSVSFEFDYEREKSIGDLIKLLRSLPLLELERPEKNEIVNEAIKGFEINHYTELIAFFGNSNKVIENNMLIDQFVDVNDRTQLNIYEVLNTNGYKLVNENYMKEQQFNLFSFPTDEKNVSEDIKKIFQNKNYLNEEKEGNKPPENNEHNLPQQNPANNNDEQNKKLIYILSINDKLLYKDKIKTIQDDDKNSSNESENSANKSKTKNNKKKSNNNIPKEELNNSPKDIDSSKRDEINSRGDKNVPTGRQKNSGDETGVSSNIIKEKDNTDLTNNSNKSKNCNNEKSQEIDKPPNSSEDSKATEKKISTNKSIHDGNKDNNKKNKKINTKSNIIYEFIIPIVHFRADYSNTPSTVFLDFNYKKVNYFPLQLLILNNNNSNKLSSLDLYNYIWNYNLLYMNYPLKNTDKFWFNIKKEKYFEEKNYKICYPFVIRIVKQNKIYPLTYKCSKCRWYNFCCGCVLSPYEENVKFESDDIIFVDWCNQLIEEEIDSENFDCKSISNEDIMSNINLALKDDKDNNIQSIDDCLNLFFSPEDLEDPLSCRKCNGPQNFSKNYEINKLPYVLVLALKRFKYNENKNFKLKQLITYPIDDYKIKDKIYDLFGVIYHYGGINSGHYTCAVRKGNKWKLCDDNRISDIDTNKVMNSNAYILFYISKDNINTFSYYNCMRSLLLHMTAEKLKNTHNLKDNNFFKGEPIRYKNKDIGYVVEDSIEDFNDNFIIKNKKEENNEDKNILKKNEKDKEEIKVEENKDNNQKENKVNNQNINMKGKVKVKLENKKEEQIIDKKDIEKLILIDEQKKDNKK